jgi:transposase
MARVSIDIDLPSGVEITAYERHGGGHGFEVTWPWPERCCCPCCGLEDQARLEVTNRVRVVRDLDILGQPSFWIYQALWHRCAKCKHRHDVLPPFKRKDVAYTYRFEKQVLSLLIGSNEEEVGRRLGISAETVARIVRNQVSDDKQIDPNRVITDVGIDEISLKKRHKLYVTVLSDWTNSDHPEVLAVAKGRDEAAGKACLGKLSEPQRQQIRTYRADLGPAFHKACQDLLPKARGVADRFHVAKLFNEALDAERKKNHPGVQGPSLSGGAEGISVVAMGVSPRSGQAEAGRSAETGAVVPQAAQAEEAVRAASALQGDLRRSLESPHGWPEDPGTAP